MTSTKMYCEILSSTCLKNHLPIIGKINNTIRPNRTMDIDNLIQNAVFTSPCVMHTTTARTNSESTSVIIVPPTVILTERFLEMPSLLTCGSTLSIWIEKKQENKMNDNKDNQNSRTK